MNQAIGVGVLDDQMAAIRDLNRNLEFRKAIKHAIDGKAFAKAMSKGPFVTVYAGGLARDSAFFDADATSFFPYNPAGANALLGFDNEEVEILETCEEFFEGVLNKLANAASSKDEAKKLVKELKSSDESLQPIKQSDFECALRSLIESMPRLSLGTIDSFFHRMLGLFPFEFGLGGEFEIMSDFEICSLKFLSLTIYYITEEQFKLFWHVQQ